MKFNKIVVYDLQGGTVSKGFIQELKKLAGDVSFVYAKKEFDGTLKAEDLRGADILVAKIFDNYTEQPFAKADKLKLVAHMSVGTSMYALDYLRKRGVLVSNAKGYCAEGVAELAIAAMLDITRRTHAAMKHVEGGGFDFSLFPSRELKGKTLGIIGYGDIGKRVAELGKAFGMRVEYYSRSSQTIPLAELLESSDVISINCSLNEETKGMLGKKELAMLKDGAVLINTAPALVCDVDEVISLAKKGRIKAYFDELFNEKLRRKALEAGILLTPAYGWMTEEAQQNLERITLENIKGYAKGNPSNVVN